MPTIRAVLPILNHNKIGILREWGFTGGVLARQTADGNDGYTLMTLEGVAEHDVNRWLDALKAFRIGCWVVGI